MKVKLHESVESLYWKTDDFVIYTTKHGVFGRRIPKRNPNQRPSRDQRVIRKMVAAAGHAWKTLAPAVRDAWKRYERKHMPYRNRRTERQPTGLTAYIQSGLMRQLLGEAPCAQAPTKPPPTPPASVCVLPSVHEDEFRIEIRHGHGRVEGLAIAVRITPGTGAPGSRPMVSALRLVRGARSGSTAPLPPSGQAARFAGGRYAVPNGQRFAVGVRIVRIADGMASAEVVCETVRQVLPAGTAE